MVACCYLWVESRIVKAVVECAGWQVAVVIRVWVQVGVPPDAIVVIYLRATSISALPRRRFCFLLCRNVLCCTKWFEVTGGADLGALPLLQEHTT